MRGQIKQSIKAKDKKISQNARKLILMAKPKKKKSNLSQLKKQRAHELRMAKLRHKQRMDFLKHQAEQIAMAQDPRFQPDQDETLFLNEEFVQPQIFDSVQEEIPGYPIKRNHLQNLISRISSFGQSRGYPRGDIRHLPQELQDIIRRRQNILNVPDVMTKAERNILWKTQEPVKSRISLMGSELTKPKAQRLNFWNA